MQYLVKNKTKARTYFLPIMPIITILAIFLYINLDYKWILIIILIPIYTIITKDFRRYNLSIFFLMLVWGLTMQMFALWGTFQDYYNNETAYYLVGFFTVFYLLLFLDLKKVNRIAMHRSAYLIKLIDKVKVKKDSVYYVDDEKSTLSGKDDIPDGEMNLTSFYTFIIVIIIALPMILLGKLAIAAGILSARYFPNSHFILYGSLLFLGTMAFLIGLAMLLTYLKLDLSEEKDNQ